MHRKPVDLRRQAEARLSNNSKDGAGVPAEDGNALIHELRTHQIELEMQNEELRRTEAELSESRSHYASLYDFAPVGYVTINHKGLVKQINLTLAGMLGAERCALLNQSFSACVLRADQDCYYLLLKSLPRSGQRQAIDLRLIDGNGDSFWAHIDASPGHNDGTLMLCVSDISARKRSEQALRQREAEFRAVVDDSPNPVVIHRAGRIIYVNRTGIRLIGAAASDVVLGRQILEFVYPDDRDNVSARVALVASGKGTVHDESIRFVKLDGSTLTADVTSCLINFDGQPAVLTEGHDMSAYKLLEQERERLLDENRALMRQMMQLQEEERRVMARELHDELGQLLSSINARAEFIARHAGDERTQQVAAEIVRDTGASFAASRAMLLRLRPVTLDLLGLTAALDELVGQWKQQTGTRCSLQIDGNIDRLDEFQSIAIYRLIQEALTNAHRHGGADQVVIVIRHESFDDNDSSDDNHRARLSIQINDNGCGLREQSSHQGMGLIGMRERMHALGGTFQLTDMPGTGVQIRAELPLDDGTTGKGIAGKGTAGGGDNTDE